MFTQHRHHHLDLAFLAPSSALSDASRLRSLSPGPGQKKTSFLQKTFTTSHDKTIRPLSNLLFIQVIQFNSATRHLYPRQWGPIYQVSDNVTSLKILEYLTSSMTVKNLQSPHKIHRRPTTAQLKFLNSSNSQILTESLYCQEGGMPSALH